MPRIAVPTLLRELCNGTREITTPPGSLEQVLRAANEQCPGFYERVVDTEQNRVRLELAIALDGDVVTLYLHEYVGEDAHMAIIPAIAGG